MAELRWGEATDPGQVRKINEDSVLARPSVFAVADGMGGHAAGEVASAVAVQALQAQMEDQGRQPASVASVTEAVRAANEAVHRRSFEEPTSRGMGTTLTLIVPAVGDDGRDHLVVANVGDSRAYLFADGQLRQLTRDHSYVEEMLAAGQITPDEARTHPHRHVVTRALGVEQSVAVDTWLVTPESGDRYLICSDGLVNEVPDDDIAGLLGRQPDPQAAADALVAAANAAGGRDNISVIVLDVVSAQGGAASPAEDGATRPTTRVQAEALGGWLPSDLAHGFDDTTGGTGSTSAGSASGAAGSAATATAAAPATTATTAPVAPAGKRRLVTGRTILFTALVAAVFVVAFAVTAAFGRNGYYVGFQGGSVAVYQGRPGGVLWFQPTVEAVSDLTRADLTPDFQTRIDRNPTFSSRAAADRYLEQLADNEQALVSTTTTTVGRQHHVDREHHGRHHHAHDHGPSAVIAQIRRSTELGLIVLAAIITAGAYALAALGRTSTLPANLVPFLVVILGLLLAAHLATRAFATRRRRHAPAAGRPAQRARLRHDRPGRRDLAGLQATWTFVAVAAYVATLFVVRRVPDLARYKWTFALLGIVLLMLPVRARRRLRRPRRRPPLGEHRPDQLPARRVRQDRPGPVLRRLPDRAARAAWPRAPGRSARSTCPNRGTSGPC